jgi:hypothetical protein
MELNSDSSIAELRNELDRKRRKAIDLQMNTTDPDEWAVLNSLRWELEDLDKDIYLGHFIKNNDKLSKLVGEIENATIEAQKLVNTITEIEEVLIEARAKIKTTSPMLDEITIFLNDVEKTMEILKV